MAKYRKKPVVMRRRSRRSEMVEFKIEKGIPLPTPRNTKGISKFGFHKMEIGDSILIGSKNMESGQKISQAAGFHGRANNKKFVTRKAEGGVRVWRIE